ncbi:cytochrome D terminal oxidase polypeptide subunit [Corynebacterium glutamicum MT]|uniref:Cytochrome d ubiquinol oxidase subunit II n=1 Tax=Corynebacterium glutamicum TaxID=1718 RepID=A0AB36IDT0_CORGT|nr:cytochrome d ubiquinol oxidase subunit II [Corynebacterium glutamicum]AGN18895.1 cytochrome D terminal oxidase polypeptide subunit [Corynebacterium glutamicum SCgG1]AGN21918.1 cytochrome D terminal oxidase polypeptide subunit [Corynebacterium glutamicum SCgG2]EGV41405.1 cytochrome bd-type quinol oxidase, subunit 2 [Corynebacterium glutamicum S9114]EOA65262.1 cytochrome D terminal oxidase polypeptide subunit [Corynebacterium glutamicum MT]EPP40924.1 cytochrome D terminal oxidase polypeptide 
MDLNTFWFILIAFLFSGYFLLEGFDFGVGILAPIIGKDSAARNTVIRTIGPVWDGNEVWLIVAGGALFAAFPEWYATMFSGMYLPLFLVLVSLIMRVVGLEWRKKVDDPRWQKWSDRAIFIGSWTPPLMWGFIFANILRGMPIKADHTIDAAAALPGMVNVFAILGALAFTALFALHGLAFIRLKTAGRVRTDAAKAAPVVALLAAVTGGPFVLWAAIAYGRSWSWILAVLIIAAVLGGAFALIKDRDGLSFLSTSVAVIGVVALLFSSLFPNVMPTTLADGVSLDIWNASASDYAFTILTWTAAVIAPLVVLYQGWTYWVFRKRLHAEPVSA